MRLHVFVCVCVLENVDSRTSLRVRTKINLMKILGMTDRSIGVGTKIPINCRSRTMIFANRMYFFPNIRTLLNR